MVCSLMSTDERPRFTQSRQGVAGHMVSQRRERVVRLEFLARHEHCHDIPSRTVDKTLADDREGHATQFSLREPAVDEFVEDRDEQREPRPDVVLDEFASGVGRMQHLPHHEADLPGGLAEAEHPFEQVADEVTEFPLRRRACRPLRQRHLSGPLLVGVLHALDIEPLLIAKVVVDGGQIHAGGQADVADRRRLVPPLGKLAPCGRQDPLPRLDSSRFFGPIGRIDEDHAQQPLFTQDGKSNACFNQVYSPWLPRGSATFCEIPVGRTGTHGYRVSTGRNAAD